MVLTKPDQYMNCTSYQTGSELVTSSLFSTVRPVVHRQRYPVVEISKKDTDAEENVINDMDSKYQDISTEQSEVSRLTKRFIGWLKIPDFKTSPQEEDCQSWAQRLSPISLV